MPRPLSSTHARALQDAQARENIERARDAKRRERAGMRDVTSSVQNAPAMPGDRTNNGADMRKSRKPSDKLASHMPDTAYVVGDMTIMQDATVREVRRSPSRMIVRNVDGTTNVQDTLALLTRWRHHRASNTGG